MGGRASRVEDGHGSLAQRCGINELRAWSGLIAGDVSRGIKRPHGVLEKLQELALAEVVELDVVVQAAVAKALEGLRVRDSNAKSLWMPVVVCARKRNELVDGDLVRAEFEHERNGSGLFLQRAGESIDPACLDAQPGGLGRPNAARDLRRRHPFLRPAQDAVRAG